MRVDLDSIAENAFEDIKETLSKAPLLKYFSESDLPKNLGDVPKDALGFVKMQHGKPVTSVRVALPVGERRYSQIEKELFCPILGMEKESHPGDRSKAPDLFYARAPSISSQG